MRYCFQRLAPFVDVKGAKLCQYPRGGIVLVKVATISLLPLPVLLQRGRIVKPGKSKLRGYFFSVMPRRFTIFVFTGCSVSLQSVMRCCIIFNTNSACFSVLQLLAFDIVDCLTGLPSRINLFSAAIRTYRNLVPVFSYRLIQKQFPFNAA